MKWEHRLALLGVVLLAVGHSMGLFVAPREVMMGDVGRILYVHVPTAWVALVMYLIAFVCAIGTLWTGRRAWDATMEGSVEVGAVLNALLLVQGSIWARPTWGIWWTWDPRLTTAAVLLVLFIVVLVLRRTIEQTERRMTATAVATIVAFVDVPIVYFSVKWWRTLHQPFSNPKTVSSSMVLPLRIAAFGMLFLALGYMLRRRSMALARLAEEDDAPDLPELPPQIQTGSSGTNGGRSS